jgi:YHS domain-containing protein
MTRLVLFSILLLAFAWAFWRLVDGIIETFGGTTAQRKRRRVPAVKLVRDPVCGTWVSPSNARVLNTGNALQYFCSEECRGKFEKRS